MPLGGAVVLPPLVVPVSPPAAGALVEGALVEGAAVEGALLSAGGLTAPEAELGCALLVAPAPTPDGIPLVAPGAAPVLSMLDGAVVAALALDPVEAMAVPDHQSFFAR